MKFKYLFTVGLIVAGFFLKNFASETDDPVPKSAVTEKGTATNSNLISTNFPPRVPTNALLGRARIIRREHISDTVSPDGKTVVSNRVPASVPRWRSSPKATKQSLSVTNKVDL